MRTPHQHAEHTPRHRRAHPAGVAPRASAALLAGAALWFSGCASPAGPILQASAAAPVWPTPPDPPRLRYLGEISTDKDLRPGRNFLESIGAGLFGEEAARGMTSPMGVTTDDASRVFVADGNGQALHVFDLDTRRYARWEPREGFSMPVAVAWDASASRVLVSDSVAACVFVFDSTGAMSAKLGEGILNRPAGLAVAGDGRVFIADVGAHQIVVLDHAGAEVARIGERGSALGAFNYPTNVAIDRDGNLYVSDSLNFRVQVFGPNLRPALQIGRQGDLPGYFAQPKGVAIDPDGHVYVVDANFEAVQVFTGQGQLLLSVGREGRGPGEFWLPAGIHIDAKGRVWIADSYNQRIQVFQYLGGVPGNASREEAGEGGKP